jgi:hypothetical protein
MRPATWSQMIGNTRFGLESADVELDEAHRFVVESRCFSQVSGIVDANLPVALHASKLGRENPHGLDERPCSDSQSKKNDACNWLKHQTMTSNVPSNRRAPANLCKARC